MVQKIIKTGLAPNDGNGDTLLTAFRAVNDNFTDLYGDISALPTVGLTSREIINATSAVIGAGATADINVAAHKGYVLYQIQTNAACWVRIYANSALRQADSARTIDQDPLASDGVIAEIVTDGASTILFTPGIYGFNAESPVSTNMAIKITNLTTENRNITLNITLLKSEI